MRNVTQNQQSAISFNSENMWFPTDSNDVNLYYYIQDTVHTNCHGGQVLLMGWR